jgi:hypothetical protein
MCPKCISITFALELSSTYRVASVTQKSLLSAYGIACDFLILTPQALYVIWYCILVYTATWWNFGDLGYNRREDGNKT